MLYIPAHWLRATRQERLFGTFDSGGDVVALASLRSCGGGQRSLARHAVDDLVGTYSPQI